MSVVNLGLAIAAIVLALFAILCEIMFYMAQTRLNKSIADENSQFAQQMTNLLGELRGLTTVTQERLAAQQDKMVDAIIHKGEPAAQVVSDELHDVRSTLERLANADRADPENRRQLGLIATRLSGLEGEMQGIARRIARDVAESADHSTGSAAHDRIIATFGDLRQSDVNLLKSLIPKADPVPDHTNEEHLTRLLARGLVGRTPDGWYLTADGEGLIAASDAIDAKLRRSREQG